MTKIHVRVDFTLHTDLDRTKDRTAFYKEVDRIHQELQQFIHKGIATHTDFIERYMVDTEPVDILPEDLNKEAKERLKKW